MLDKKLPIRELPNADSSLSSWYKITRKAKWQNVVEIRNFFPYADLVGRERLFGKKF